MCLKNEDLTNILLIPQWKIFQSRSFTFNFNVKRDSMYKVTPKMDKQLDGPVWKLLESTICEHTDLIFNVIQETFYGG